MIISLQRSWMALAYCFLIASLWQLSVVLAAWPVWIKTLLSLGFWWSAARFYYQQDQTWIRCLPTTQGPWYLQDQTGRWHLAELLPSSQPWPPVILLQFHLTLEVKKIQLLLFKDKLSRADQAFLSRQLRSSRRVYTVRFESQKN